MKTLTVKVQVIKEHLEKMDAKEVLKSMLSEFRYFKDEKMLVLYKSDKQHNGYMRSFAEIKEEDFRGGDLSQIIGLDTYDRMQKDLVCEILAKYADKIDCEYGIKTIVDDSKSIRV